MIEPKNAIIINAEILIEDNGILSLKLDLDYGHSRQSFGMYDNREDLSFFVKRIFETLNVFEWSNVKGQHIRVISVFAKVHAIGHFIEDKWFEPSKELKKDEN